MPGNRVLFGNEPASWSSRKQTVIALSAGEAELISFAEVDKEIKRLRRLVGELGYIQKQPTKTEQDNNCSVSLSKRNSKFRRVKHIGIKFQFIRELVSEGEVEPVQIGTNEIISDVLTKPKNGVKGREAL